MRSACSGHATCWVMTTFCAVHPAWDQRSGGQDPGWCGGRQDWVRVEVCRHGETIYFSLGLTSYYQKQQSRAIFNLPLIRSVTKLSENGSTPPPPPSAIAAEMSKSLSSLLVRFLFACQVEAIFLARCGLWGYRMTAKIVALPVFVRSCLRAVFPLSFVPVNKKGTLKIQS